MNPYVATSTNYVSARTVELVSWRGETRATSQANPYQAKPEAPDSHKVVRPNGNHGIRPYQSLGVVQRRP